MIYTIKRGGTHVVSIQAEGSVVTKLMQEDLVNMSFSLQYYQLLEIGDNVIVNENNYRLNQTPTVEKISTIEYRYTCVFESIKYELAKTQLLFLDEHNKYTQSDYSIYANAKEIIEHVIANAQRVGQLWNIGDVVSTEMKLFTFSSTNLLMALGMLAEVFEKEYWIVGQTINFGKKDQNTNLTFQYGRNKGLRSITRQKKDETNIYTRLYATGGNTNLPIDYGSSRLKMSVPYLEKNTSKFGLIEHSVVYEDIYPTRVGYVTGTHHEFPDSFWDSHIDFDINEVDQDGNTTILIPGISAKVTFNTGQLAGYTFDLKSFDSTSKRFVLKNNTDDNNLPLLSGDLSPAVFDKYVLTDIQMPASYVLEAEQKLKMKAQSEIDRGATEQVQYNLIADPIHFEREGITLDVGVSVRIIDSELGINRRMRIIGLTQNLQNKHDVSFEIADDSRFPNWFVIKELMYLKDTYVMGHLVDKLAITTQKVNNIPARITDVLGTDSLSLFVESSAGELLDADNLNTSLTPTVMRYFKDFTNDVVKWQWYRESGTTQEDKDADEIWAIDKNTAVLELNAEDFTQNIHLGSVAFTCQATVNNETITVKIEI
ncbi:phage tail protein [Flavobacterium sp. HSC-61S13]|uniref:phage tail protein n=1 Tax=Flavobacterium sp. HSC-61S13 TaxID=2910963 RepID=UPI00209DAEF4|nr:phage tail protein [Flavobacterium sp. HSC-61S13]MCP1997304.1 hypothetical protein [Flavobacterium sp. HSC-61S13]